MRCDSPTRCGAPRRPPKTAARTVPSQRLHGTRIQPSTKATRSRRHAWRRSRDALPNAKYAFESRAARPRNPLALRAVRDRGTPCRAHHTVSSHACASGTGVETIPRSRETPQAVSPSSPTRSVRVREGPRTTSLAPWAQPRRNGPNDQHAEMGPPSSRSIAQPDLCYRRVSSSDDSSPARFTGVHVFIGVSDGRVTWTSYHLAHGAPARTPPWVLPPAPENSPPRELQQNA